MSVDLHPLQDEQMSQTKPWSANNSRNDAVPSSTFNYSELKTPPYGSVKPDFKSTVGSADSRGKKKPTSPVDPILKNIDMKPLTYSREELKNENSK